MSRAAIVCLLVWVVLSSAFGADAIAQGKPPPRDGIPSDFADLPRVITPKQKRQAPLTPAQIYKNALSCVVTIYAGDKVGTGFFALGRIITCFHVVEGCSSAKAVTVGGRTLSLDSVVAVNRDKDVIEFAARKAASGLRGDPEKGDDLMSRMEQAAGLNFGDWSAVSVGDPLYVIGSPLGIQQTLTAGLVSGKRVLQDKDLLQLSAGVSPGSSGSPVLNSRGEVIGMVTSSFNEGQTLNFALSAKDLKGLDGVPLAIACAPRWLGNVKAPSDVLTEAEASEWANKVGAALEKVQTALRGINLGTWRFAATGVTEDVAHAIVAMDAEANGHMLEEVKRALVDVANMAKFPLNCRTWYVLDSACSKIAAYLDKVVGYAGMRDFVTDLTEAQVTDMQNLSNELDDLHFGVYFGLLDLLDGLKH